MVMGPVRRLATFALHRCPSHFSLADTYMLERAVVHRDAVPSTRLVCVCTLLKNWVMRGQRIACRSPSTWPLIVAGRVLECVLVVGVRDTPKNADLRQVPPPAQLAQDDIDETSAEPCQGVAGGTAAGNGGSVGQHRAPPVTASSTETPRPPPRLPRRHSTQCQVDLRARCRHHPRARCQSRGPRQRQEGARRQEPGNVVTLTAMAWIRSARPSQVRTPARCPFSFERLALARRRSLRVHGELDASQCSRKMAVVCRSVG